MATFPVDILKKLTFSSNGAISFGYKQITLQGYGSYGYDNIVMCHGDLNTSAEKIAQPYYTFCL